MHTAYNLGHRHPGEALSGRSLLRRYYVSKQLSVRQFRVPVRQFTDETRLHVLLLRQDRQHHLRTVPGLGESRGGRLGADVGQRALHVRGYVEHRVRDREGARGDLGADAGESGERNSLFYLQQLALILLSDALPELSDRLRVRSQLLRVHAGVRVKLRPLDQSLQL